MNESGKPFQKRNHTARSRHSVLRQLATLETMTMEQLREKWLDLYGSDPPPYKRQFLIKRLAYRIQELFYGGLSEAAKAHLGQVAREDPVAREITGTRWNGRLFFGLKNGNGNHNRGGQHA